MAAPNIVGINTLVGVTTFLTLSSLDETAIVSNPAASGASYKLTSVIVSNTADAGTNYCNVGLIAGDDVVLGDTRFIQKNVGIETGTSLVVLDRASSVYVTEFQSLTVQSTTATNVLDVVVSYESIED